MHFELIVSSFFSFVLSLLILLGFKWNRNETFFYNGLILLLVAVGLYALIQTTGRTILLLPVLFFLIWIFIRWRPCIDSSFFLCLLPVSVIVWLFFYFLLYGFDGELRIPHEDYISYSRYAYYNDKYGVENIGSYYNELTSLYPGQEFYHHFELWMSSMFSFFNGRSRFLNQYLVTFPLLSVLVFSGIYNLLQQKESRFYLSGYRYLIAFVGLVVFFTNRNLYSSAMQILGSSTAFQLPINQINYFKLLPVVLILLFYLNTVSLSQRRPFEQVGLCFLYVPVLPLFVASYGFSEWWSDRFSFRKMRLIIIAILISGSYIILFYRFFGNGGLSSHLGFKWIFSLQILDFVKSTAKVAIIYFLGYVISMGLIWGILYRNGYRKPVVMLVVVLLSGVVFLAAQNYVFDMNQMLYNLAEPLVALLSVLCFVSLLRFPLGKVYAVLFFLVLCIPGFLPPKNDYIYELPRKNRDVDASLLNVIQMKGIKSLLIHSEQDSIAGVLQANELLTNQFSYLNCFIEDLSLVNTTLSLPLKSNLNRFQLTEIQRMREKSPVYQFTKEIPGDRQEWTLPLMRHFKIQWLLTNKSFENHDLNLIYSDRSVYLYQLMTTFSR